MMLERDKILNNDTDHYTITTDRITHIGEIVGMPFYAIVPKKTSATTTCV